MKRIVTIWLAVVLTSARGWAEGPAEPFVQSTSTERMALAPGGTVRFNKSVGDLSIEGWDQTDVEITVIRSTHYFEPSGKEKATARLETVRVMNERRSDQELTISTVLPSRARVDIEYRVFVPRDARLVIDHRGGTVYVGNVTGDVEAENRHGDILLMVPEHGVYVIDARSRMGHIAAEFDGKTSNRYLVGQRFRSGGASSPHRLRLHTGFGGITIVGLPQEAL